MKKLRLVRFLVQPEILVDENGELSQLPGPVNPLIVPAVGWKAALTGFATEGFDTMLADLEKRLNAGVDQELEGQPAETSEQAAVEP